MGNELIPIIADEIADEQPPQKDKKGWAVAIIFAVIAVAFIALMAWGAFNGKL